MKGMKNGVLVAGLAALAMCSSSYAVVIDEATFKSRGGDPANLAASIRTQNDELRRFSYALPWRAVGDIGGCTATWLGDKDGWSYVLTAAHCVGYKATETAVRMTFTGSDGQVIASGQGTAHVPLQRIEPRPGLGGASTDIAILKLPTQRLLLDEAGQPVERPILNDARDEMGRDVIFVGYGSWGVGTNGSGAYWPKEGQRRLYGRSRIDSIYELDYGIGASYQASGPSPFWARVAAGDSGSAWWQIREGKPVIIATTNGGHATLSTGARVSMYVDWIKSIYPEARFLSAERPQGCIVSLRTRARYCLPVGQRSDYALPSWIYEHEIYVDAAPGAAVMLSPWDNLSYNRIATFIGTVENHQLKHVRAVNGMDLDFSRPHSMRVVADQTSLGCIVSLTSGEKYCLPAGQRSGYALPSWIYMHEVQVEASPGTAVMLSDWDNLSYHRVATFSGTVQNAELKGVKAWNGEKLDFSRPRSMRVVKP